MNLTERLRRANGRRPSKPASVLAAEAEPRNAAADQYGFKTQVHRILIERLDLSKLNSIGRKELEGGFRQEIIRLLHELRPGLSLGEEQQLAREILDEIFGLGPIEPLLNDPAVEEIMVNSSKQVYCARAGKISLTGIIFKDDDHLLRIIERVVSTVGRRIDESSPMVDARLLDGSRVNAIIPPIALDGPCLTIRRFPTSRLQVEDLIARRTLTEPMAEFLRDCVRARLNILVSGGTASGKTTLLNVLSGFIPSDERITTIEDSAELQLQQPHVIRLETRPPNVESRGQVTARDLVRNSLRMRVDRIVVGEVRGEEALDMLQAMNTGHDGSISTVHANSPRDSLTRLEIMIALAGVEIPLRALRQQIASALDLVIQTERLNDGSRKVTAISEVTGMEGDIISMQDIFVFREEGVTPDGKVRGRHICMGMRPKFADQFAAKGIEYGADLVGSRTADERI